MHKPQNLIALSAQKAANFLRGMAVINRQISIGTAVLVFGCLNSPAHGADSALSLEKSLVVFEANSVLPLKPEVAVLDLPPGIVKPRHRPITISPTIRSHLILVSGVPARGSFSHHPGMLFVARLPLREHLFPVGPIVRFDSGDLLLSVCAVNYLVFGEHPWIVSEP